jgi:hypothetical protein
MRFLILSFVAISLSVFAGSGHKHGHSHGGEHEHSHVKKTPVTQEQAKSRAMDRIKVLIFKSKIDSSWSKAILDKAELKTYKNKKEWLVIYNNKNGVKGKKLYIFLKLTGEFVAANFTGK